MSDDLPAGWFVRPLQVNMKTRRPHYYGAGESEAACGYDRRDEQYLRYDRDSWTTLDIDPRLGETLRWRRPCHICDEIAAAVA